MAKKIRHLTEEWKRKIGKANSKKMKEYWDNGRATKKQIINKTRFKEMIIKNKKKYGDDIHSREIRKQIGKTIRKRWEKGEFTEKQKSTQFKKGYDKRRVKTQFKKGHRVDEKTRLAVKKNRATQKFPKVDSKIEVKIQEYLKILGIDFFTHQHININHSYQCDIFIPSLNLVIECDGDYWHDYPIGKEIDHIRTKELIEKGFKVLRLWEKKIKVMSLNEFEEELNGRRYF